MQYFYELPSSELSSDIEWMLQSGQVDDSTLVIALIREYYQPLANMLHLVFEDDEIVADCLYHTFALAVARRHTYRAEIGASKWFFALLLQSFRGTRRRYRIQRWARRFSSFSRSSETTAENSENSSDQHWLDVFRRLGEENRLLIWLHLVQDFSLADLAIIYKQPEEILHGVVMTNLTYLLFLTRRMQGRDGKIRNDQFKTQLSAALRASQRSAQAIEAEINALVSEISSNSTQRQRSVSSFSLKEFALIGAVVVVAAFLWLVSGIGENPPASTQPQGHTDTPQVVTLTASPTPIPSQTASATPNKLSATPTAGSLTHNSGVTIDFSKLTPLRIYNMDVLSQSGPAALSLVLQAWGWKGDPNRPGEVLQPNEQDRGVLPYEVLDYVNQKTSLRAISRLDGDIGLMCDLTRAGYPVIVQRGMSGKDIADARPSTVITATDVLEYARLTEATGIVLTGTVTSTVTTSPEEWFASYEILAGCDDVNVEMYVWRPVQAGMARFQVYAWEFDRGWWAFDNLYILVYSEEKVSDLMRILSGQDKEYARDQSDENTNFINAVESTSYRVYSAATLQERFFTWFNRGTALTYLDDYTWAAISFDTAFEIYEQIPEESRPWRILWYNTRPYWAYFYTGRYQDVIDLATATIQTPGGDQLEESYYWRALAREAVGDWTGALADMNQAVELNRMFTPAIEQLERMTK